MNQSGDWVDWGDGEYSWWATDASNHVGWGVGNETGGWGVGNETGGWGIGNEIGGWGGHTPNAGWGVGAVGLVAGATELVAETEDVAVVPPSTSTAIRLAQSVGTLNLDIIICILMLFLPPLDIMPLGPWGSLLDDGCFATITAAMRASRVWYGTALATCAVWGGLLVLARTRRQWRTLNALAGDAPRRLLYRDGLPNDLLDAALHKACAVYASASSSWRHWGAVLEDREMPFVEVLLLLPSEHSKPDGRLDTPTRPLIAPNLRIFHISSPCAVIANTLDTLVISNCAPDQLAGTIAGLCSLRRLHISRVNSEEPIDWTALLAKGTWPMLEELRIVCRSHQSYALALGAVPVHTPCLRELYATAAVLVSAPVVEEVHMVHVRCVDYLRTLRWTPSVTHATVRASSNVQLPLVSSSAWPGAATVRLDALVSLKVFGDIQQYDPSFFSALSVPNADVRLYCDMAGSPNHQAVLDVDAILRTTLAAADSDVPELLRAVQHARRAFKLSGHSALLSRTNDLLANGTPDLSIDEMRRVVGALSRSVDEIVRSPVASNVESMLRDVLTEVATAVGSYTMGHEAHCALEIEGNADCVQYTVMMYDLEGRVRTIAAYMTGPQSTGGWTGRSRWERKDSLTWAASRMLTGLAAFDIKEIVIVDNGFDALETLVQPNGDVAALSSSLRYLTATNTLRFKFSTSTVGLSMIQAVEPLNMPALTRICVEGPPIDSWGGHYSVPCYRAWFDALEVTLWRRKEAGRPVESLNIEGRLCLCQFWIDRVCALVGALRMNVACTRGVGDVCVFCRTSESEFWP